MTASNCNQPAKRADLGKLLGFAGLAVALAGCSTYSFKKDTGPPPEPNVMPTNTRTKLAEFLQGQLNDPSAVREAFITEPRLMSFGAESRYAVCVRYNAKDGYGQYTGVRENIAIYFHGNLTQYVPAAPGQCTGAPYVPFPELERLKKPGT
jgi:hypothetical protein